MDTLSIFTAIMGSFVAIFLIICILSFFILTIGYSLAKYLMKSIALFLMGRKKGIKNSWLAFIPIADYYVVSNISDKEDFTLFGNTIKFEHRQNAYWIYLIVSIVSFVGIGSCSFPLAGIIISGISFTLSIVLMIFRWRFIYDLMETYRPSYDLNILFSILSVFIPLFYSIILIYYNNYANGDKNKANYTSEV